MSDKQNIQLKIITPERIVFDEKVDHVILPSSTGEIDILPNHTTLMTSLNIGPIIVYKGKEEIHLAMGGGYCEVNDNLVTVLADTAERAEELNEERIMQARQRAQTLMEDKDKAGARDQALVSASLQRSLARLKVMERYRKHHSRKNL